MIKSASNMVKNLAAIPGFTLKFTCCEIFTLNHED